MPELQTIPDLMAKAESAAVTGDFAAASELLRTIAPIQEDELGPFHPELASTLNNLAVVAEKTGRTGDAATCYRRAVAIASASLPPDDPMLAASRQNLEDFCRARGVPIEPPALVVPAVVPPVVVPPAVAAPPVVPAGPPPPASRPVATRGRRPAFSTPLIAIGTILVVMAALFFIRPRSSGDSAVPEAAAPAMEPKKEPVVVERAQPPQPAPGVPVAKPQTPTAISRGNDP